MRAVTLAAIILVAMFAVLPAAGVGAQAPSIPHYFFGTLKIDGADAPAGTTVEARGTGVVSGPFNPIVTTRAGKYGDADPLANVPRLLVQGDIEDGAAIEFFVNGVKAGQRAAWKAGAIKELNLTVTINGGTVSAPALDAQPGGINVALVAAITAAAVFLGGALLLLRRRLARG